MEHVTREEYLERLGNLPIKNPTREDMMAICPHLSEEQVVAVFTPEKEGGSAYVACPPIRIRGGFQVVAFYSGWEDRHTDEIHPPALRHAFTGRTLQSYADGKSHGDIFGEYPHMEEAIAYAEEHWGDQLILDDWVGFAKIYMQDPSDLDARGYPKTKAVVHFTTNRGWNEIVNDRSQPQSVLLDNAIVVATLNPFEGNELKGGRGGAIDSFNCAYCGGGLFLDHCNGCEQRFRDDHFRSGWSTPLPPKIVELFEGAGHVFQIDPAIARQKEHEQWAKYFDNTS